MINRLQHGKTELEEDKANKKARHENAEKVRLRKLLKKVVKLNLV